MRARSRSSKTYRAETPRTARHLSRASRRPYRKGSTSTPIASNSSSAMTTPAMPPRKVPLVRRIASCVDSERVRAGMRWSTCQQARPTYPPRKRPSSAARPPQTDYLLLLAGAHCCRGSWRLCLRLRALRAPRRTAARFGLVGRSGRLSGCWTRTATGSASGGCSLARPPSWRWQGTTRGVASLLGSALGGSAQQNASVRRAVTGGWHARQVRR